MTPGASLLGEAELHGLVDGHLVAERRADVLRKLAASPGDRALVEAWQEQNDLIRAAFRDVEHEALPVALDLAPPRLRCIEGGGQGEVGRPLPLPPLRAPARPTSRTGRTGRLAAVAAILVVAAGVAGAWLTIDQPWQDDVPVATASRAGLEATLADRATAALESGPAAPMAGAGPSTIRIPDLAAAGFRLTGVAAEGGEPGSLALQYRDAREARVVLSIASTPEAAATTPKTVGKTLVWRRGGSAYALAGTLPAERLRALARSLDDDLATR